jgi:tetratricopeptide (TPR) repeat protein
MVLLGLLAAGLALAGPQVWAWYHFRTARLELERYHNPQAIRHLQVCLRTWPEDADVLLLAARAARRARSYAEAEHLLMKVQQARGVDAAAFEQLLLSAERRVDQVMEPCWHYVEQGHPDTPLILEALTRGYLRQYRLGEARKCLDHWMQRQPDNPQALYLDGLFHLDYAHHARSAAEASYRRAVELDPEHEEARLGLAVTLIEGRNFPEAIEHLEYMRRCQPDNLSVQVGLAECRGAQGQRAEAVRLTDDVLARQPQFVPAMSLRGRLALEDGQPEEAEPWLRQAVERDPSNHRALYSLVLCLRQNGKEEEARERQRQLDQTEEDLARYNEIVTKEMPLRPRDPALHYTLGKLLMRAGHREEGLHWVQSALRLDPQYAPARKILAEYQQKAKAPQQQPNPEQE